MTYPRFKHLNRCVLAVTLLLVASAARAGDLPDGISRQLPIGYVVLTIGRGRLTGSSRDDYMVVLAHPGDNPDHPVDGKTAPARPLLMFHVQADGTYALVGRNDIVVMRHDQGGQCDPFDAEQGLVMKGAYVTVQNEVSCGSHWSDYITFRYDKARGKLLFDSEINHSWKFNPSNAPNAEALVPVGPPGVTRADPRHPVAFSAWKPPR